MQARYGLKLETAVFLGINIGISLAWRVCRITFPSELFDSIAVFLILIGLILALNLYRALYGEHLKRSYAAIAVLNVVTTVGVGNSAFLTSLGTIFRVVESLI